MRFRIYKKHVVTFFCFYVQFLLWKLLEKVVHFYRHTANGEWGRILHKDPVLQRFDLPSFDVWRKFNFFTSLKYQILLFENRFNKLFKIVNELAYLLEKYLTNNFATAAVFRKFHKIYAKDSLLILLIKIVLENNKLTYILHLLHFHQSNEI